MCTVVHISRLTLRYGKVILVVISIALQLFFSTIKYGKMSFNKYVQKVVERSADRFRHCADAFRSIFNGEFRIGSVISG